MKNRKRKWTLAYGGIGILLGAIISQSFTYFTKGEFSTATVIGALPVSIILIVINVINVNRKKDRTPELDERTVKNMLRFHTYSSHIFLGLLFISLATITFLDIKDVPTSYLWIIIFTYMCFSGIGTIIVKRQ
ncbi:hypothetical protein NSA56_05460 [Oceanobacillus caeni]|uniref:hypothetical protein n=1 Tax=Oceanobacillus TaxID=182709 RepID=UPI00062161A3|nr:hypothetical protein [Oceanobacillus caeni]KKE79276.1 hypothetical protein WH51_08345 [Bacilli bacterium VT-13-104]PZD86826.1 hypothetical protein DEJ64_06905 [Bacilli bacterium]MBU8792246.1 hypothetical protein [Oceanobacillus caeni]MCR1833842.1 hypothetical protein [Oceanobacillus caeni]PZD88200.1 hypothetical protein DEJ60_07005 [Bacilli bacterium]